MNSEKKSFFSRIMRERLLFYTKTDFLFAPGQKWELEWKLLLLPPPLTWKFTTQHQQQKPEREREREREMVGMKGTVGAARGALFWCPLWVWGCC